MTLAVTAFMCLRSIYNFRFSRNPPRTYAGDLGGWFCRWVGWRWWREGGGYMGRDYQSTIICSCPGVTKYSRIAFRLSGVRKMLSPLPQPEYIPRWPYRWQSRSQIRSCLLTLKLKLSLHCIANETTFLNPCDFALHSDFHEISISTENSQWISSRVDDTLRPILFAYFPHLQIQVIPLDLLDSCWWISPLIQQSV